MRFYTQYRIIIADSDWSVGECDVDFDQDTPPYDSLGWLSEETFGALSLDEKHQLDTIAIHYLSVGDTRKIKFTSWEAKQCLLPERDMIRLHDDGMYARFAAKEDVIEHMVWDEVFESTLSDLVEELHMTRPEFFENGVLMTRKGAIYSSDDDEDGNEELEGELKDEFEEEQGITTTTPVSAHPEISKIDSPLGAAPPRSPKGKEPARADSVVVTEGSIEVEEADSGNEFVGEFQHEQLTGPESPNSALSGTSKAASPPFTAYPTPPSTKAKRKLAKVTESSEDDKPARSKRRSQAARIDYSDYSISDSSGDEAPTLLPKEQKTNKTELATSDSEIEQSPTPPAPKFNSKAKPITKIGSLPRKPAKPRSKINFKPKFQRPPKPSGMSDRDYMLSLPKAQRGNFPWHFHHRLCRAIIEHHFGLTNDEVERIFSNLFPHDLVISKKEAGTFAWRNAIHKVFSETTRQKASGKWDPVESEIEKREKDKSDQYKQILSDVEGAMQALGIVSRVKEGKRRRVDFEKRGGK